MQLSNKIFCFCLSAALLSVLSTLIDLALPKNLLGTIFFGLTGFYIGIGSWRLFRKENDFINLSRR